MQKGFTLIELMITLVVMVIALSIGVPNFVTWIKSNRLDTSSQTIAAVLQLARSEAVSRQRVISVGSGTSANTGDWANGAHIYTDTGTNGNAYDSSTDVLIKDIDIAIGGITINSNDPNNTLSFRSSGTLNEISGSLPRTITLCQDTNGTVITINPVGRASITKGISCP